MSPTRRDFLRTMTGVATLSLADISWLRGLAAFDEPATSERITFGSDLEPIVRLIEDTPRDRCVEVFIDQLRHGLPYRRFLAAAFFACVRRQHSHHEVYKIHSVNQVCMDVRPEERLLPLFWAVNAFKQRQEDFPGQSLTVLKGPFPSAEKATAEFVDAMEQAALERAEPAVVAMGRHLGARQTMEQLWLYGCRNGGAGGHGAISVANCFRALETIGWQEAESVLRFVVQDLFTLGYATPDAYFHPNSARADQYMNQLPATWSGVQPDAGATRELFALVREGRAEDACELAVKQMLGGVAAQAIWDAVHLATAELMVRHSSGWGLASRPLHSNTSTNAMHYAFRTCLAPRTRLLVLLQAIAWAANKTGGDLAGNALRDLRITELDGATLMATSEEAVAEIFSTVPARSYRWDPEAKTAVLAYGEREAADRACQKVFALAHSRRQDVPLFVQTARSWLCQKASNDHHEYKFLAAILEDVDLVSAEYQPCLLAASVHYFHGNQSPDNEVVRQARQALSET